MPWTACKICKGRGKIPDPKQPVWEIIEFGQRYIECSNRDCLKGQIFIRNHESVRRDQYIPSSQEKATN